MTEGHEGPAERAPESGEGVLWAGRPHGDIHRVDRSPEGPLRSYDFSRDFFFFLRRVTRK